MRPAALNAPDVATIKGLRDRAALAVMVGCGWDNDLPLRGRVRFGKSSLEKRRLIYKTMLLMVDLAEGDSSLPEPERSRQP